MNSSPHKARSHGCYAYDLSKQMDDQMITHSMAKPEKLKPSEDVELKITGRAAYRYGTIQPAVNDH
jgi:hypothetical protein